VINRFRKIGDGGVLRVRPPALARCRRSSCLIRVGRTMGLTVPLMRYLQVLAPRQLLRAKMSGPGTATAAAFVDLPRGTGRARNLRADLQCSR
jgi:hypothetical protein